MNRKEKKFGATIKHTAIYGVALLLGYSPLLLAAPLDDISMQNSGDMVLATIRLTDRVQYLQSAPATKTRHLIIYYKATPGAVSTETWQDGETRNFAGTAQIPAFTVTTRDQATNPKLLVEFAREVDFSVMPGGDGKSFIISIKSESNEDAARTVDLPLLPTVVPPPAQAASDKNAANVQQAYKLMLAGRDALSTKNYQAAIEAFNELLLLPPNPYSQDGQEWVGVARERAGQIPRAKAEYELYLKLYTEGAGVPRVKLRLANLAAPALVQQTAPTTRRRGPQSYVQASISSRYYYSQTDMQTTYPYNGATQTSTYSLNDQSMLISNIDATARSVNENFDNRIVFRDIAYSNFLPGQTSKNRVNAAYYELKNLTDDYSARLGRQLPTGGGVMGRFDGLSGGYGSPQDWRVNAVVGQLVDFYTSSTQPTFYGMSVDKGPVSVYLLNQTIESIVDRQAVGAEYKYFEGSRTAYAMVDYDIYFNELNATMLNGTLGVESTGTSFNFMADFRKSPSLSTRNALNGAGTTSVQDLLTVINRDQLKQLALSRTGSTAYTQLGAMQKLDANWQVGADIKLSKTNGMPASGNTTLEGILSATPDTGLEKTVTAQVIASNMYSNADITSLGTSYLTSDYVQNGGSIFIYNRTAYDRDLFLDSSWNFYSQVDNYGNSLVRNMPMLRVSYRMLQSLSFDAELGAEVTTSTGSYQVSTTTRAFGSFGFRWDM